MSGSTFEVIVAGGGHAGIEAAAAAARMGRATALVTPDTRALGRMSCNPAIGGVGKGQIVREIDALGGVMGRAADAAALQYRILNRSKGRAVWGPRAQADRHAYERWMRRTLGGMANLTLIEGEVTAVTTTGDRASGVELGDGRRLNARAVVVTAGTFMRGMLHRGELRWPGGRIDEAPTNRLSHCLQETLGLRLDRLRTDTCARLDAASIDYRHLERQDGDAEPTPFSLLTDTVAIEQLPCWIAYTNPRVHQTIRQNAHRASQYAAGMQTAPPRYCPNIETKIERFADRDRHHLFLEPEGRDSPRVYMNGMTTGLPPEVQLETVRGIEGLENARILQYGYAIEYDYLPPTQLAPTLQTKRVPGLFTAGQVNGTTGYEEAAGQGLMAGVNAARHARGEEPVVLRRDQAYIGVMIDDLVTKGVAEPYRMFTSRSEYRLELRADNADLRLTPLAASLGLIDDDRRRRFEWLSRGVEAARRLLETIRLDGCPLERHLANPNVKVEDLAARDGAALGPLRELVAADARGVQLAATDCLYAGYVARQRQEADELGRLDSQRIPEWVDYAAVPHLRHEARQRLAEIRPLSLGQALRISGITPADISVLSIHCHAGRGGGGRAQS